MVKLVEKNSKFYYEFTNDGKTTRRICKNCKTKEEAKLFVSKLKLDNVSSPFLISNVAKGMFEKHSEHMNRLNNYGKNLSERTLGQKKLFIKLIVESFGNCRIDKLAIKDIEQHLLDDHIHSGSWKNFYLETFSNIYDETKWKCPTYIPRPKFQRFSRNSKKPDIFLTNELNSLLTESRWDNYSDYLLFVIIASCGLRLGEARALKVKQFDFQNRYLVVNGYCLRNGQRTTYNKCGSIDNDKLRVVPLPTDTVIQAMNWINKNKLAEDDYLFSDQFGNPVTQDHLEWTFKKALKRAKINVNGRRLIIHSLRFTYVTRMRRNLPIEQVQRIVGHSSLEMTQYYTRNSIPELLESITPSFKVVDGLFD